MRADSILYLKKKGIDFKSAESPDLWLHLESLFAEPGRIGPKFASLPAARMSELIDRGEEALLEALMARLTDTGKLSPVAEVIEMPFVVGTDATVPLTNADRGRLLDLINEPGTPQEHIVHILPTTSGAIPATHAVTVTGGLYADGHTAGFYALRPGSHAAGLAEPYAWLATPKEIAALVREMERRIDDITVVARKDCEAMITRARKTLGS